MKDVHRLLEAKRPEEALRRIESLIARTPTDPSLWQLRGRLLLDKQTVELGLQSLHRAAELAGQNAEYWIEYGHCLVRLGQRAAAMRVAQAVRGMRLARPALHDALGTLLTYCEEPAKAHYHFEAAVAAVPDNVSFRYNLATVQRMLGRFADAENNLDMVITGHPHDYDAYLTRADLRRQTKDHNHIAQMTGVAEQVADPRRSVSLYFALAKELEDLSDFSHAFAYLRLGCDTHRGQLVYDVHEDVEVLERLCESHCGRALGVGLSGYISAEPIFIVGLPRSGTTLVERIVASHPAVKQGGELDIFPQEIVKSVRRKAVRQVSKLEFVDASLQVDPAALGGAYIDSARAQLGPVTRFTDKLPLNYLYAGLICRALPRAPIIALRRGAMDSCYAMYKTLFAGAYPFSYDLTDIAKYYVAWRRLMDHWENALGEAWLTVRYEDLIVHQDQMTRRMIEHCGLEWDERCLNFHEQRGAVTTASAVQVRRRMNADSIGMWKHYEKQLRPLREYLQAHDIPLE